MSLERIIVFVAIALPAFFVVGYALFDAITTKRLSVAKKVHRLKGTAATVAARPLLDTLQELERLLRDADKPHSDNVDQLTEQAMQQFCQIREFANSGAL